MMDSGIINTLGLTLLHFLWQGLVIALVYATGKRLLRDVGAESRYAWALATLILLALAPVISFLLLQASTTAHTVQPASHGLHGTVTTSTVVAATESTRLTLTAVLPWIVAFWVSGVLLMSLRLSLGWHHIRRLRNSADFQIPSSQNALLEQLRLRLGVNQAVQLARSAYVHGPVLIGILRPLILLPAAIGTGLTPRQLEMVLAHELAHLRRFDHLINLFQTMVETLLFYHPVVRWVSRDLRVERELASDEMAAKATGDRIAYAETLLMLERERGDRIQLAMAMADEQVVTRVRRLLGPPRRQNGSIAASMTALVLVLTSMAVALNETRRDTGQDDATDTTIPTVELGIPAEDPVAEVAEESMLMAMSESALTAVEQTQDEPESEPVAEADERDTAPSESDPTVENDPGSAVAATESDSVESATESSEQTDGVDAAQAVTADTGVDEAPASEEVASTQSSAAEGDDTAEADDSMMLAALDTPLPDQRPQAEESALPAPVTGGEVLQQQAPQYPRAATRQGHEGSVEVRFLVDENGRVRDAEVISESPKGYGFGEEAIRAVEQWRFEPFRREGDAVSHEIRTGFDFAEPDECSRVTGTRINRC
jgi:bla regulator protein blaR1